MSEREREIVPPIPVAAESKSTAEEKAAALLELEADFMSALPADGRLRKMEVDYSEQVDEIIPRAEALLKNGKVADAVDLLAPLEKLSRLGCDMKSNSRLVRKMVKLACDGSSYDLLDETIRSLAKKRSLIKYSIKNMIKDCCQFIDVINDETVCGKLIETLRAVTAGKIYVEVERARLTKRCVDKLEADGRLEEARTMIMELQIETYGSMEIKEKILFLLHQMRLSIALNDYFRAAIIARKINVKFFEKEEDEEIIRLKLEYYNYMVGIGLNEHNYLDVCKHILVLFRDEKLFGGSVNKEARNELLKRLVLYIVLSRFDNEQSDLMHRIQRLPELAEIAKFRAFLDLFIRQELIMWREAVLEGYGPMLRASSVQLQELNAQWPFIFAQVFPETAEGNERFDLLHKCVAEHNVRMVAKYYSRVSFDRMAKLLEFSVEEMEKYVCKLIAEGTITGVKIHRPTRIINLRQKRPALEVLDEWESSVRNLTDTLDKVSHLILKEEMVHGVRT